ncbi:MAG: hypothetical protein H0W15_03515 [Gemmatimonadales bacterium]|nr:hypothetical protein [Gemmatimonadales bacterium]
MHRFSLLAAAFLIPSLLPAQVRYRADPNPDRTIEWLIAGGQVKQRPAAKPRSPIVSQFDTVGLTPMGVVGDTVTLFLFPDGANLSVTRYATIRARRRFDPPVSWRAACDDVAHTGWMFELDAPATSAFAVVVPGRATMPVRHPAPRFAQTASLKYFLPFADSVYQAYAAVVAPKTERSAEYLRNDFYQKTGDAGWTRKPMLGVRGPGGYEYGVVSFWLRDDYPYGRGVNTTGTWIVNAWGYPVAMAPGNVDIYGTVDIEADGIDEVVTSSGLIRWDGKRWRIPVVYSDEPCLARKVMPPPPGVTP